MPRSLLCLTILIASSTAAPADSLLVENFDDVSILAGKGWALINNSFPVGQTGWFQGNPAIFAAQSGDTDSYISADYLNADSGGDISNWLLSPVLPLFNGDIISFYTRTEKGAPYPDRLELRLSTNGNSTNVGATPGSTGDFPTLLLAINPSLASRIYPEGWTSFSVSVTGLSGAASGRYAFRYFVPDTDIRGDYIGIDTVSVESASVNSVPEPAMLLGILGSGMAAVLLWRRAKWIAAAAVLAMGVSGLFAAGGGEDTSKTPKVQPAKSDKGAGGLRVFMDPATGKVREAEKVDFERMAPRPAALRSAPAVSQTVELNGMVGMRLDDSQMSYSVATKNPDGTISMECVQGAADARKVVARRAGGTAQ